jgi:hypothetical protein
MTEAEWLACDDPAEMLKFLQGNTSERKLRVLSVACFRRLERLLPDPRQHQAIEVLEKMAQGEATRSDRVAAGRNARQACFEFPSLMGVQHQSPVDDPHFVGLMLYREFASSSPAVHALTASGGLANWTTERARQSGLLRDIFGNPFRPITFDPAWLTSTVVALARGIYDDRAFDRMPILADALQDAGCDNADVLNHCRDEKATHVRGCWVVDLVLGLS